MKLSPNEIAHAAIAAGFTGDDAVKAVAVCLAESGGDTEVMARTSTPGSASLGQRALGLWMISNQHHPEKIAKWAWRDPYDNAVMAYAIYIAAKRSFSPWNVTKVGTGGTAPFETFLPDARIAVVNPTPAPRYVDDGTVRSALVRLTDMVLQIHLDATNAAPLLTPAAVQAAVDTALRAVTFGVTPPASTKPPVGTVRPTP